MGSGHLRRRNNFFRVNLAQAGNVFRYGARKEFDILGEIAKVCPQFVLVPGLDVHAV